jgi:hypothetical protein
VEPEVKAEEGDEGDEGDEEISPEDGKPRKKGGFQRKIERYERELAQAAEREARRDALLEKALEALQKGGKAPETPPEVPAAEVAPKREDFEDYQDFIEARTEWKTRETFRAEMAKINESRKQETAQTEEQKAQQEVNDQLEQRKTKGREKYSDFEKVALDPKVPINPLMAEVIAGSDIGEEVAYFLGKNRDEALRIAKLSPLAAAKEMGALEASLKAKPVVTTTKAPTPASTAPVTTSTSSIQDLATMDMESYAAKRKAQGADWARR